jgi:hypothetical protein
LSVRILAGAALLLVIVAGKVGAQRNEPIALRQSIVDSARTNQNAGPKRFGSAMLGGLIGIIAGAFVGAHVPAHDCQCDDPGLDEFVYGAFAGSVAGAALGASVADLGSVCAFDTRFTRSLVGSAVTATAAYFVAGGRGSGGTLIAVPVGAIGGSLAGLGRCWKSSD